MTFSAGIAAKLYQQQIHPRVLCGPQDIVELRKRIRTGWGRKIILGMKRRALEAAGRMREKNSAGITHDFLEAALWGVLQDDEKVIDVCLRTLESLPSDAAAAAKDRLSPAYSQGGTIGLAYDLLAPRMSARARAHVVTWLAESSVRAVLEVIRGRYLLNAGMNIPMAGMITATLAALAIDNDPGAPDLTATRAELVRFLEAAVDSSLGPQGYPAEDVGYGTAMTNLLAWPLEGARRAGWMDVYKRCPRFTKFGRAMLHFMQPWGEVTSNTGDYGADFGGRTMVLPRLAAETDDAAILWMHGTLTVPWAASGPYALKQTRKDYPEVELAKGFHVPPDAGTLFTLKELRKPTHPSKAKPAIPTAFMDEDRGIVSLRSSWKSDATFVVFDGAHRPGGAQGHAHDSGGHFSLSAVGEYFAIDTGRYNIEQEHHNVVLADGKSGTIGDDTWKSSIRHAHLTEYSPHPFVDCASVDSSQMSNCYWARRTLGLVKGEGAPAYVWTAEDVNFANDYRDFTWLLNAHPDSKFTLHEKHATLRGAYHGNLLDIHFVLPRPDLYPRAHVLSLTCDEALSGSHKEYGDQRETGKAYRKNAGNPEWGPVYVRPRLRANVAGYNGRFLSLMLPRIRGAKPATVETLPSHDGSLAARITFGDVVDTFIWAYQHRLLEADGVIARGQWCIVRRSKKSGKVLEQNVHKGEMLSVG